MAKGLTSKQQKRLEQLDKSVLLEIVEQLIADDPQSRTWLVNNWLSEATELLARLSRDYDERARYANTLRYYEADHFFISLSKEIVQPMALQVDAFPEHVEKLAEKMLLDFERLGEEIDTSSGVWCEYSDELFSVWLQSLTVQDARTAEDIALTVFKLYQTYEWFDIKLLAACSGRRWHSIFQLLAKHLFKIDEGRDAIFLLIRLREFDEALNLLNKMDQPDAINALELADCLIDDARASEAIALLERAWPSILPWTGDIVRWETLLATALMAEGRNEEARASLLDAFSRSPTSEFWALYLKAGGDEERDLLRFVQMAAECESESAIEFLADLKHYVWLNQIITDSAHPALNLTLPEEIDGPFWRKLSSELYKQGYSLAAVILRRKLAEKAISRVNTQSYSYAANDAKKAIDYAVGLENDESFISSQAWFQTLYKAHFRKSMLWSAMREKIAGLTVSKEQGAVLQQTEVKKDK